MMPAPTWKHYRDWILHALGDIAPKVTDYEIMATMAEVNREITVELGLRENMQRQTLIYTLANQYIDLPDNVITVERVSLPQTDGSEAFLDVIDSKDSATRRAYSSADKAHAYSIGRRLYLSWKVTKDTDIYIYCLTYFVDSHIDLVSSGFYNALGKTDDLIPIYLGQAMKWGVLSDLMATHGITELHEIRSRRWEARYRNFVARAKQNIIEVVKTHRSQTRKEY